jgi:hypothetical protein
MYTLQSVHTLSRTVESVESYETIDSLITDALNYIWEDDDAFYFITKSSDEYILGTIFIYSKISPANGLACVSIPILKISKTYHVKYVFNSNGDYQQTIIAEILPEQSDIETLRRMDDRINDLHGDRPSGVF